MNLEEHFLAAEQTQGDIHEHLHTIRHFAGCCNHITEFGVRNVVSTWALLITRPQRLVCYDTRRYEEVDELERVVAEETKTNFTFVNANVLEADIEETDLLFIDTYHTYAQLRQELQRHAGKVREFIILHDTFTHRDVGEDGRAPALRQALLEFLLSEGHDWDVIAFGWNNNGLTVLKRHTSCGS